MRDIDQGDQSNGASGSERQKYGRRDVLKTAGGLGALALVPSAVSADSGASIKEVGIGDEFYQLLEAGKTDMAFALLDEHDVGYTRATDTRSSGDGVSTQDFYETGNSSATFYTSEWDASQDEYAIGVGWSTENTSFDWDFPAPVDVAVLAFEADVFGYVDDSAKASGRVADHLGRPSVSGMTSIQSEPGSPEPGASANALIAEFNDDHLEHNLDDDENNDFYPTGNGVIQMIIRKQNTSTQGIVAGLYTHTYSFLNAGTFPVLENVGVEVPGTGITVSVPDGVDKWQLPDNNGRDQDL